MKVFYSMTSIAVLVLIGLSLGLLPGCGPELHSKKIRISVGSPSSTAVSGNSVDQLISASSSFSVSGCPLHFVFSVYGPEIEPMQLELPAVPVSITGISAGGSTSLPVATSASISIPADAGIDTIIEGSGSVTIDMTGYVYASSAGCNEKDVSGTPIEEVNFISNARVNFDLGNTEEVSLTPRFFTTGFGAITNQITFSDPLANDFDAGFGLGTFFLSTADMPCAADTIQAVGLEDVYVDRGLFRFYETAFNYSGSSNIYIGPILKEHLYEVFLYCVDPASGSGSFYTKQEILFAGVDTKNLGSNWTSSAPPFSPPDFNGNIDLFFAVANISAYDQICFNDGSGGFSSACTGMSGGAQDLSNNIISGDIDNNGSLEFIILNQSVAYSESNQVCYNHGSGNFSCSAYEGAVYRDSRDGVLADFVGNDGFADLIVVNDLAVNQLCTNNGAGAFSCADLASGTSSDGVAASDINDDGYPDFIVANSTTELDQVCMNDQDGTFTCNTIASSGVNSSAVEFGDLDGDGDDDAIIAVSNGSAPLFCENVSGVIASCTTLAVTVDDYRDVLAFDFDSDGDIDLVFGNYAGGMTSKLCVNTDGAGTLSCGALDTNTDNVMGLKAIDLDFDGDLDIAMARLGQYQRACINSGSSFTCSNIGTATINGVGVAAGNGI